MKKLKLILFLFALLSCLVIFAGGMWVYQLNQTITQGLANKRFLPPTEYFAAPTEFSTNQLITKSLVEREFSSRNYRARDWNQKLYPGDYAWAPQADCATSVPEALPETGVLCALFAIKETADPELAQIPLQLMVFDSEDKLVGTYQGNPLQISEKVAFEPELVAQYLEGQPISQSYHALGEIPTLCLNAVLAIEDAKFLEHSGFSWRGLARAVWSNTFGRGIRSGGSTITQQLVKNYFLTAERTLKRKVIEFAMSVILEAHASKDEILETYLNVIYMGQNGPFQVRGFGAASQYYFNKPLQELELPQCSLLAAVLNSPGLFDPFRKQENALKRRSLVLDKMVENEWASPEDAEAAKRVQLPFERKITVTETAPYYINAVNKEISEMGLDLLGLKIYTGLSLVEQKAAQEAVRNELARLETSNKKIKELKEKKNLSLEGVLISANNRNGLISSIVGGRSYKLTQFNRAIDGHRQIGSIMKPLVFLTALLQSGSNGKVYDPLTVLKDEKFSYKYEGQTWSPDNYGKKYFGEVPAYFALKNSLNASTASLGIEVGIDNIITTARELGITSPLQKVPSLTLGSLELYPMEVLEAYTTLARFGSFTRLTPLRGVSDREGRELYRMRLEPEQNLDAASVASLVSMMKQTTQTGTARRIGLSGFKIPAAGKTGTTSDNKDAWFAGFTPSRTAVVWVGYDNPTANGLTGASGAVPIWLDFMKVVSANDLENDFAWPVDVEIRSVNQSEVDPEATSETAETQDVHFDLVFKKL